MKFLIVPIVLVVGCVGLATGLYVNAQAEDPQPQRTARPVESGCFGWDYAGNENSKCPWDLEKGP
jgi:hypothetical protein